MGAIMTWGCCNYVPVAQLFTETSICTLTSRTTPPALSRVLSLLADHTPESLERNSASHTLTLSLSQHVLLSCDPKAVAHDLRECAVLVLNKAVDKYVSAVTEVGVLMHCDDVMMM